MKQRVIVLGIGILLLLFLTAVVSGERIASDNKTPAKVERQTAVDQTVTAPDHGIRPASETAVETFQATAIALEENESTAEPTAYEIPWQSINAGGDDLSSTNYRMLFSVGQSVIGYATSDNYEAGIGYWYGAGGGGGCECGVAGDVNHDLSTDPLDVSFLVNKVYLSLDALYDYTATCPYPNGDVNCDSSTDPLDVSYLVNKVYLSLDALCTRCP
ncbi:hypothetical protein ACFLQW_01810 [Candidatus Zixiibacteriota bacterium]